jgi:ApbE superfamily uncharacterized protein (UPF0280 family)
MGRRQFRLKETIATIVADDVYIPLAEAEIRKQRELLETYLFEDPEFGTTLEPYEPRPEAPAIAHRMSASAAKAGVGPMAAVAGAIAESAVRVMVEAGATHALVDNGGDIALAIDRPVTVGLFAGPSSVRNIGLRFDPRPGIFGICTSSGTVGHSLSFGRADAATVIAADVCLADAAATALGNAVRNSDETHLQETLAAIGESIEGLEGLIVIVGDALAVWGDVPTFVRTRVDPTRIA